jgi:hypothetical protein
MLTVEAAGAAQFLELEQEAMSASNHLCQQQQQNGGVVSSSRNLAAAAVGAIISPAKNKSVRSKIGLNSFEFIKVLGKGKIIHPFNYYYFYSTQFSSFIYLRHFRKGHSLPRKENIQTLRHENSQKGDDNSKGRS